MKFEFYDNLCLSQEERVEIANRVRDNGFNVEVIEYLSEDDDEYMFNRVYIEINTAEELVKLNKVIGKPLVIDGEDLYFTDGI